MEAPKRPTKRPEWLLPMDDDLRPRLDKTSTGWRAGERQSAASSSCTEPPKTDSSVSPAAYKLAVPVAAQQTQLIILSLGKCWPRSKPMDAPPPREGQTWRSSPQAGGTLIPMQCFSSHRKLLPGCLGDGIPEPCSSARPLRRDYLSQLYSICPAYPHSGPGALITLRPALNPKSWQAGLPLANRPSAPGHSGDYRCTSHWHCPGVVRPPCTLSSIPAGSSKDTTVGPAHGLPRSGVSKALAASWGLCSSCIFLHCPLTKGWTDCYQSTDTCAVCTRSGPPHPQWPTFAFLPMAMTGPRGPHPIEPGFMFAQAGQTSPSDQATPCCTCGGGTTPVSKNTEMTPMPKVHQSVQPRRRWLSYGQRYVSATGSNAQRQGPS